MYLVFPNASLFHTLPPVLTLLLISKLQFLIAFPSDNNMGFEDNSLTYIIEGIFISIIGTIGLIGNLYSLKVYGRQKEHRLFHHLLLQLAIFDIVSTFLR